MGRRLGQHFLTDPAILNRIVDAVEPAPEDVVLEIGAGMGTLTRRLAPRVARVVAVERDGRLMARLRRMPLPANVELVEGDALKLDWSIVVGRPRGAPFKLIGNIPYAITSPLIDKALTPPRPPLIVFLVQREVAHRLSARPGTKQYGALTVGVQAAAVVERLFAVRAGAFSPPPAVDSALVRMRPRAVPLVRPEEQSQFRRFVVGVFGQRRKQLAGALSAVAGLPRAEAARRVEALGLDPVRRAETLAPEQLVLLFRELGSGRGVEPGGGAPVH